MSCKSRKNLPSLLDKICCRSCNARPEPFVRLLWTLWPVLLSVSYINGVVADWIDPDTPKTFLTTRSLVLDADRRSVTKYKLNAYNDTIGYVDHTAKGKTYHLVMSDEFNVPDRTFHDGRDPKWTAIDKNDYTNDALHYYTPSNVWTNSNGELEIVSTAGDTHVVGFDDVQYKKTSTTKHFKSAMLQTWNKFCFTGGIIEAEVMLPGWHDVGGLWPAFWMLGNLARHTYVGSSAHVWPFSTHRCDDTTEMAQLINGCTNREHYGLDANFGRGAPEIDIFEVQPGGISAGHMAFLESPVGQPFMSASYQVAPGRPSQRPGGGFWPGPGEWYTGMKHGNDTCINISYYGVYNFFRNDISPRNDYWSDAISFNRQLYETHFTQRHTYRLEWGLPKQEGKEHRTKANNTGFDSGYLNWYLDGELVWAMNGTSIQEAGLGTEISSEPSSILLNTAISSQWGFPSSDASCGAGKCPCKKYDCNSDDYEYTCGFNPGFCDMMRKKPTMKINWVRVYQDRDEEAQKVGCSTPERPTRRYIEANAKWYKREEDTHPLKAIQRGRGQCDPTIPPSTIAASTCGGVNKGRCTPGRVCECKEGWTGPNCLVPDGSDPVPYDQPDSIADLGGGVSPWIVPKLLWVAFVLLGGMMVCAVVSKPHANEWTLIPDIK